MLSDRERRELAEIERHLDDDACLAATSHGNLCPDNARLGNAACTGGRSSSLSGR
jgi:hypothetical protein